MEFTIDNVQRITVQPNDVILFKINRNNAPTHLFKEYLKKLRNELKTIFPNNEIIVSDDSMNVEIITAN